MHIKANNSRAHRWTATASAKALKVCTSSFTQAHLSSLPKTHSSSLPKTHSSSLPKTHSSSLPQTHSSSLPKTHSSSLPKAHSSSLTPPTPHLLVPSLHLTFTAEIWRDVRRTFPRRPLFNQPGGAGQTLLAHVLKQCAILNTDIGYCQVSVCAE